MSALAYDDSRPAQSGKRGGANFTSTAKRIKPSRMPEQVAHRFSKNDASRTIAYAEQEESECRDSPASGDDGASPQTRAVNCAEKGSDSPTSSDGGASPRTRALSSAEKGPDSPTSSDGGVSSRTRAVCPGKKDRDLDVEASTKTEGLMGARYAPVQARSSRWLCTPSPMVVQHGKIEWTPLCEYDQAMLNAAEAAHKWHAPVFRCAALARLDCATVSFARAHEKYAKGCVLALLKHEQDAAWVQAAPRVLVEYGRHVRPCVDPAAARDGCVELHRGSFEFQLIQAHLARQAANFSVLRVLKNHQSKQLARYLAAAKLAESPQEALLMWHATGKADPLIVAQEGVDPRLSSKRGLRLGRASYFSSDFKYCCDCMSFADLHCVQTSCSTFTPPQNEKRRVRRTGLSRAPRARKCVRARLFTTAAPTQRLRHYRGGRKHDFRYIRPRVVVRRLCHLRWCRTHHRRGRGDRIDTLLRYITLDARTGGERCTFLRQHARKIAQPQVGGGALVPVRERQIGVARTR